MSPALQSLLDQIDSSESDSPASLERALGGTSAVQLATLGALAAPLTSEDLEGMNPALAGLLDTVINSDASNPMCLERDLGGAAGVQLAILAAALVPPAPPFDPANPGAIGGGTPSAGTFTGLTVNQGTLTDPVTGLALNATWNNGAATFRGLDIQITDTASAAGSTPFRILGGAAGTTELAAVNKNGALRLKSSIEFTDSTLVVASGGIGRFGSATYISGNNSSIAVQSGNLIVQSTSSMGFSGGAISSGSLNVANITLDAFFTRGGVATIQMGATHADTPTLQTLKAHNVTTGTGADLLLSGGTGSAANGMVRIGTHSAIGAETVTGFIEIKDAGGTIRKLAVVS